MHQNLVPQMGKMVLLSAHYNWAKGKKLLLIKPVDLVLIFRQPYTSPVNAFSL
jgi:hypothetical protein